MNTTGLPTGHQRWADWRMDPATQALGDQDIARLEAAPFLALARKSQKPPPGDWRTWLFMAGRGAGKTRAGAEWTRFATTQAGLGRMALVGRTLSDVREVMIEGPSGLKAVAMICGDEMPEYQVSRQRLEWPNGAVAYAFSAEEPDRLRGPQFDGAWCDEVAAWGKGESVWDMLQMALRIGRSPRAVVTTTPKPVPLIRRLVDASSTAITRGKTYDNASNLSSSYLAFVEAEYRHTPLGRQELDGVLLDGLKGALWTPGILEGCRLAASPRDLDEVIVAVDPPISSGPRADECGIVAVGKRSGAGQRPECLVLADASSGGLSPREWASRAIALARRVGARRIVAETNQGGEMVLQTFEALGCDIPIISRRARVSKGDRATPVAALYGAGRVFHVGGLDALEQQMMTFGTEGEVGSPDRVDALVWAITVLALEGGDAPRIRAL